LNKHLNNFYYVFEAGTGLDLHCTCHIMYTYFNTIIVTHTEVIIDYIEIGIYINLSCDTIIVLDTCSTYY